MHIDNGRLVSIYTHDGPHPARALGEAAAANVAALFINAQRYFARLGCRVA